MTPDAALVYASETRGILQAMSFLLVVAGMLILWMGGAWVLLKIRVRGWKKHEAAMRQKIATQAAERDDARRELQELRAIVGDVEALKNEVRRVVRIREKTELRLVEQNGELAAARERIAFLQKIVDHVDT